MLHIHPSEMKQAIAEWINKQRPDLGTLTTDNVRFSMNGHVCCEDIHGAVVGTSDEITDWLDYMDEAKFAAAWAEDHPEPTNN